MTARQVSALLRLVHADSPAQVVLVGFRAGVRSEGAQQARCGQFVIEVSTEEAEALAGSGAAHRACAAVVSISDGRFLGYAAIIYNLGTPILESPLILATCDVPTAVAYTLTQCDCKLTTALILRVESVHGAPWLARVCSTHRRIIRHFPPAWVTPLNGHA